jgi:hypothetical protein
VEKMPCCISTSKVVTLTHHIGMFYVLGLLVHLFLFFIFMKRHGHEVKF